MNRKRDRKIELGIQVTTGGVFQWGNDWWPTAVLKNGFPFLIFSNHHVHVDYVY